MPSSAAGISKVAALAETGNSDKLRSVKNFFILFLLILIFIYLKVLGTLQIQN